MVSPSSGRFNFPHLLAVILSLTCICGISAQTNSSTAAREKQKWIVPGATWHDTSGNVLHAHAGGMTKWRDRWYWVGQNEQAGAPLFAGLNLYSSDDLINWDYEGLALSAVEGTDIAGDKVVERPKIVYNPQSNLFVLWFHADNSTYSQLRQGVALSPNITGPYTFIETFTPLSDSSQDFGLFQDNDGASYAMYSNGDADAAHDVKITKMNATFTGLTETVHTFYDFDHEAPVGFKVGDLYAMYVSHKTGYRPNDLEYFTAKNLSGPWSIQSYLAPPGTRGWNSQSTLNIKVQHANRKESFIYGGDQWSTSNNLEDSRYIWLPLTIDEDKGALSLEWRDLWAMDINTGKITSPKGTTYEAEDGALTGAAYRTRCPNCSGNAIVTSISGSNNTLTIKNIKGTGEPQWVSFYYHNPDGLFGNNRAVSGQSFAIWRLVTISINGGTPVVVKHRDTNAGIIMSSPLQVTFTKGNSNFITIGGYNGAKASDIDKIIVY